MTTKRVLGLDLDGVVFNYTDALRRHAVAALGGTECDYPEPTHWSLTESGWNFADRGYLQVHTDAVNVGMYRTGQPYPGAIEAVRTLAASGYHIRIVTHRVITPEVTENAVADTVAWLGRHQVPYGDVCFIADKKAVEADVYIDDAPTHIAALRQAGRDVLVFDQLYNRHLGGRRAFGWGDVLDTLL